MFKGNVIRISGFDVGLDVPEVELAQADSRLNANAVAVLTEDMANDESGTALITGVLEGLDTAALGAGSQLFLDATTPGAFTTTVPSNPEYTTFVGWVRRASGGTNGSILVKVGDESRPMGSPYTFGGDMDTGVEDDFYRADGEFDGTVLGGGGGVPVLGSEIQIPPGNNGILEAITWETATATAPPPGNQQTDFTVFLNGAAVATVQVTAGNDPNGNADLSALAQAVAGGDTLAVQWSDGNSPGQSVIVIYVQRS
jgi:hypothetical protein